MKTVYVLGAGFSKEAQAPLQYEIIEEIFKLDTSNPSEFESDSIAKFRTFLTEELDIPLSMHSSVALEDVFTPLDRCLLDGISFRGLDVDKVKKAKELVQYLIGVMLQFKLRGAHKEYIRQFATYLVKECKTRENYEYKKIKDPVSVISTNWDILLDNAIMDEIDRIGHKKAVVDYCCYISSYNESADHVKPGLEILGMGGFNVKLLKLHGSYNWLQCPRCLRLYINFGVKIAVEQRRIRAKCRHCDINFAGESDSILESNLIMPTFLKNLTNPQYKLIWQNAGIELSEANKVVFIGYSLPYADFEMRQLLSRMIRKNATIEVVTYGHETAPDIINLMDRYQVFFGNRRIEPFYEGASSYIKHNLIP